MHNLNAIEPILDDHSREYSGPGAEARALRWLPPHALGFRVVAGICPTLGLAGGFALGGGHSPLKLRHGLCTDNVLARDVVTADGRARGLPRGVTSLGLY